MCVFILKRIFHMEQIFRIYLAMYDHIKSNSSQRDCPLCSNQKYIIRHKEFIIPYLIIINISIDIKNFLLRQLDKYFKMNNYNYDQSCVKKNV
ncbi:hypothetical protein pb186bvf_020560 [Paramecium bursaria]